MHLLNKIVLPPPHCRTSPRGTQVCALRDWGSWHLGVSRCPRQSFPCSGSRGSEGQRAGLWAGWDPVWGARLQLDQHNHRGARTLFPEPVSQRVLRPTFSSTFLATLYSANQNLESILKFQLPILLSSFAEKR